MGSPDLYKALTQTLKGNEVTILAPGEIQLTPYLSIVVAILYMMAADGDISDRESSQLQSVIGSDSATLRRAVAYASSHDIEQFLNEAPPVLDAKLRLCLLTNVCDSLMSDGRLAEVELALFDRLLQAMGHNRTSFQPYFDVIAVKDRISVFGNFDEVPPVGTLSPPLMLIVSMLYMMSADGSLAEEEIGRLSTIVGSSQALLKAGLRYVSKVRAPQFLPLATAALDETQRLSVLLNACDTMMSDRQVVAAEEQLMRRMLDAFGIDTKGFEGYRNILQLKNEIPQDDLRSRSVAEASAPSRVSGAARTEGVVFERKQTWEEETGEAGEATRPKRQKGPEARPDDAGESALSSRIASTMQDNIDNLTQQFDQGLSLGTMASNALDGETLSDAAAASDGPRAPRAYQDGEGAGRAGRQGSAGVSQPGQHWKDAEGPRTEQHLKDAQATQAGTHWKDAEGPRTEQHLKDAQASQPGKHWKDGEGPHVEQRRQDAGASQPGRHWEDDAKSQPGRHWKDAGASQPGQHWQDAAMPGERSEVSDTTNGRPGRHLVDDRKALDKAALDDDDVMCLGDALLARMDAVEERTRTIRDYLDPMLSASSIAAVSRLPVIAPLPPRPQTMLPVVIPPLESQTKPSNNEAESSQPMLLTFDEGGPIMTQSLPAASKEESRLNRQLRYWSLVLLPALFLTYGATMVGETTSGHSFITSENLATDARTVHQMATVQQTVYRIAPDAVLLSTGVNGVSASVSNAGLAQATPVATTGSVAATNAAELSDREKADSALERRKQTLEAEVQRHQSASAIAAERQQWFAYAKSIVLLGLGMAFWGVLFRSMRMLQTSSVAGIAGLLVTMNAYWLFLQF